MRAHPEGPGWAVEMASPLRALRAQLQQAEAKPAEVEVGVGLGGVEEPATRVIYRRRKRNQK